MGLLNFGNNNTARDKKEIIPQKVILSFFFWLLPALLLANDLVQWRWSKVRSVGPTNKRDGLDGILRQDEGGKLAFWASFLSLQKRKKKKMKNVMLGESVDV